MKNMHHVPGILSETGIKLTHKNQGHMRIILYAFIASRVIFFVILFTVGEYSLNGFFDGKFLLQYDGQHYYDIATKGYVNDSQYAFFPLFPLVIRFFDLFGVAIIGTVVFNNLLTLITAYLLYIVASMEMHKDNMVSLYIALIWIFSPTAIATNILYSEALFVFLSIFTFFLYNRKLFFYSGITLGLSVACRSLGSLLFFSFLLVMIIDLLKKKDTHIIPNIIKMYIPATLISLLYPVFLYFKVGNWHYFVDVQYIFWGRIKTNLFESILRDVSNISDLHILFFYTYVSLIICVYIVFMAIKNKENLVLIVYLLLTIITIFSTSREIDSLSSASFYRYIFGCGSVYLLLNQRINFKIIIILTAFMSIFAFFIFSKGAFLI